MERIVGLRFLPGVARKESFLFLLIVSFAFCVMSVCAAHAQYSIGGTITGLSGGGLVLQDDGGDDLSISAGASSFTFATKIASRNPYSVTVKGGGQPTNPWQTCAVMNGTGNATANVTNVLVSCTTNLYSISATVSGSTTGDSLTLTLQVNGSPTQVINPPSDGAFTFTTQLLSGTTYSVGFTQSASSIETCTLMASINGTLVPAVNLTVMGGDVSNIWVTCQPTNFVAPLSAWTKLVNKAPLNTGTLTLLSDGTVITPGPSNSGSSQSWLRLRPDKNGSYVNGTWSFIANSNCPHGYYASQVLTDGRFFVAGGEYPGPPTAGGSSNCTGYVDTEIYDFLANTWTSVNPPTALIDPTQPPSVSCPSGTPQAFLDMISEILPDGSVLMAPVCPKYCGDTLIYNPHSSWSGPYSLANTGNGTSGYTCSQQEDTWVKLVDGSILTADPPDLGAVTQTSERYDPTRKKWLAEKSLGFDLYDTYYGWSGGGETGPAFLLPNGKAIFIGGSGVTGTYDPVANNWTPNNITPNGPATGGAPLAADDEPGAMMVNGIILVALNFNAVAHDGKRSPMATVTAG